MEMGDAHSERSSFNNEAYEYDDEDSVTLDNLGQLHYRLLDDKEKAKVYFDLAHEKKPAKSIPFGFSPAMIWRQGIPRRRLTSSKLHWKAAFLR